MNLFIRTISGIAYAALVMGSIFSGAFGQAFLACFLAAAAVIEWMQFNNRQSQRDVAFPAAMVIGIIYLSIYCFSGIFEADPSHVQWFKGLMVLMFTTLVANLAFNSSNVPRDLFHHAFSLLYIGFPLILLPMIAQYKGENQPWMLASVFILIWTNDTFAYLTGKTFGKHKLYERISPNKTWEGFFGGVIFTFTAAFIIKYFFPFLPTIGWMGLAVIILIFGNTGDLFESAIKRSFGLKDSGKFMPGHGGILDRIDSLLFALPLSYFYLRIIENTFQ